MQRAQAYEVAAGYATLIELFERRVADAPEALAYAFVRDDLSVAEKLTRAALDARVRSLLAALRPHAEAGDAVLLVYPPGLEFVCAFWACVLAGTVPVPVSSLDAARLRTGLTRLRAIADDAQARLVLCDERTLALVRSEDSTAGHERWLATDTLPDHGAVFRAAGPAATHDVAYLQYTSGSTSTPRGVMVTHAAALANCRGLSAALLPDDDSKVLSWLPHFHDYGLVHGIVWPLFAGISTYLMSPITFLRRPLRWLEAIECLGISHSGAPNFAYAACLAALDSRPDWQADLRCWQHASCGAEPIRANVAQEFSARLARHGLHERAFAPAYGLAEATLLVSVKRRDEQARVLWVDRHALERGSVRLSDASKPAARALVRCGTPIEGLEVRVVDPDTRHACAADAIGELWVGGSSVGAGYLGRPDESTATFDQVLAGDSRAQWLRTGDLGFLHDGQVVVTGRLKDLLIINGRNIAPQDVESTAERAADGLRVGYGAVFSIDGADGEQAVVLQEVERRSQSADLLALAAAIRLAVASEHELPLHSVVLLKPGALARTSSGKIQRNRCRDDYLRQRLAVLFEDRAAAPDGATTVGSLASLLEAARRIAGRVEPLDGARSAIENGLDSLQCFRLIEWVQARTGVVPPSNAVLGIEPLSALASHIDAARGPGPAAGGESEQPERRPDKEFALTPQQQGVWLAEGMYGHGLYNLVQATRIEGRLDVERLHHALAHLVARHEALRLSVFNEQGTPRQRVHADVSLPWTVHDLQHLTRSDQPQTLHERLHEFATQRLELDQAPLLRMMVLQLAPHEHVVALLVHHLVFDGWSAATLMREWAQLYARPDAVLPPAPGYSRFLAWQQRWLASAEAQQQLQAQLAHLADTPPLRLPSDQLRSARPGSAGALLRFEIDAQRTHALRAMAASHNATPFMLLMAVFQAQLHRLSGQKDFAIGVPASARPGQAFQATIGLFTNTLVLRTALDGDPSLRELLQRVHERTSQALAQQDLPFDRLNEAMAAAFESHHQSLFQVGLALHNMGETGLQLPGMCCEPVPLHGGRVRHDLWLAFSERGGVLQGELEYARELFDEAAAQRLAEQYLRLLDAMLCDADTPLSRLDLLGDRERDFLLQQCNATHRAHPLQWCLHELWQQQAQRSADAIAVRAGDDTLAYAELEARANQLAHHLIARGVGPGAVVGVCLPRSLQLPVALLAVLKAGAAYLPLDTGLPPQRLAYMLRDAGARIVLESTEGGAALALADAAIERVALDKQAHAWATLARSAPPQRASPDSTAYVIYTSGSSGEPKAVVVSHRAACNHQHWALRHTTLGADHSMLQLITIGFDASVLELFTPLLAGATLTMAPPGAQRDLRELVRCVRQHAISHLVMTPSMARALLDEPELAHCTSVQHLLLGGEPLSWDLVRALRARLGEFRITNCYGPTEAATTATFHEVGATLEDAGYVPIGLPIDNLRCHVLDATMQPVPLGVLGELYIGGVGLAHGYLNRPELTAERFVADALQPGQLLYRTGDLARRRADGALLFAGRTDAQVKVRGQRIEPGEIEATLLRCPGVRQAAVTARPDAHGEHELVACVVADAFDEAALREQLRQWLPSALLPAWLLALPALPLLPSGKLDLRALPAAPLHDPVHAPPATDTERALHTLWCQLLARASFSRHDNFFNCGGHSLTATRLIARIRAHLGAELPLRSVFEHPTIASLASAIDSTLAAGTAYSEEPNEDVPQRQSEEVLDLTPQQQGVWLAERMYGNRLYNLVQATRIEGRLDVARLQHALAKLVVRHEALRLELFDDVQGTTHQRVCADVRVQWIAHDLRGLAQEAREPALQSLMHTLAAHRFEFARAPLLQPMIVQLAPHEHVVALLVHHLVFDGWSAATLMREWAQLYARPDAVLPPAPGYSRFLAWQQRWLASAEAQQQLQAQLAHLADTPPLRLPSDQLRSARPGSAGALLRFEIDAQRTHALRAMAASHNATPFMLLMALFQAQLHRLTGQLDFAVGTPAAARPNEYFEATVGLFTNTLALRAALANDPPFCKLLADVREQALLAYQHQTVPFDRLVEAMANARDANRSTLFQVGLALQNMDDTSLKLPGTHCSSLALHRDIARMDLWLAFSERGGVLQGELEYARELFDEAAAQRLAEQYLRLLDAMLCDADTPLSRLDLLGDRERDFLLQQCNATHRAHPLQWCLHELWQQQAQRSADAIAVRAGDDTLAYAELEARANQLAHHLIARGVGPGAVVGVCLPRSLQLPVALLAVLKAGAAYLPLDTELPPQRLAYMLRDAGARIVLESTEGGAALALADAAIERVALDKQAHAWATLARSAPPQRASPDSTAYVIYTSGSSGEPKAVVVSHRAACNHQHWALRHTTLGADHSMLQLITIGFDASVLELFTPLLAGATLTMAPPGAQRDLRELVRCVRQHAISHLVMTPSMARALLDEPELAHCTSVQHLLLGGEPLSWDLVRALRARLGEFRITNCYGPTEAATTATFHEVGATLEDAGYVPIGLPIDNLRCHVLDATMQPVPLGVLGELYIGGVGLAHGYLNRPELTAERFVADALQPGQLLYRTGDLARRRADGALLFAGRTDAQVKVRGQRIEPGEIEATLLRCPGVRQAAVTARPDAHGEHELVACVVADAFDEAALREQLRQWLPSALLPAWLLALPALPLLPSGKLDLRALPAAPLHDPVHAPPATDTERALHTLWCQLLARASFSRHDNFFNCGGHSLTATRLIARIRAHLGAELPLRSVFEHPTIASLASAIDSTLAAGTSLLETPIKPAGRDRPLPLSHSQQRMWLVQQMDPQSAAYHMPFPTRISGDIRPQALRDALAHLVARHEVLRTSLHMESGVLTQRIADTAQWPLSEVDLGEWPAALRESRARELAQQESRRGFDLGRAPMARALLIKLDEQDHVLLVVIHHAIGDQWSGGVLARELAQAYEAALQNRTPTWAPLPVQYADYCVWQREQQGAGSQEADLAYWRAHLQGTPTLALPLDALAGADVSSDSAPQGAVVLRKLPGATVDHVRRLAAAHGATPFMVLLAAFKLLLSRYCTQDDIALGTPIANRLRADTEDLVGTMVNTLVLRTDLSGDPSFAELLLRVKETALQAYAHQNLPYERLVDELRSNGGASPAHVRVLFNVPNAPWELPRLGAAQIEPFEFDRGAAQFELAVTVDTEYLQRVHFEYATTAFAPETVQRLASHYLHLLHQALANPQAPSSSLLTLTAPELQALQQRNRDTARPLPAQRRVDELISARAAQTPQAVALSQGAQQMSYAELDARANRLAHYLQRLGVAHGSLVGLCLQRTLDMVVALLAVMKSGGAYVPLDPAFPRDRLRFMVEDSGLSLVITHSAVADPPGPARDQVLDLDARIALIAQESDAAPPNAAGATDLAYVLYTSGSTGRPKGVEIEHRSLVNFIASMQRRPGLHAADTLLAVTTLSFDIAGLELLLPLTVGARVELATRDEAADPRLLIERLAEVRPTTMQATPATWGMLLAAGWSGDPGLVALCGGEPLPTELAERLLNRCKALWNLYGPTETTIWSTIERVQPDTPITIGLPIDNTSVWVLDAAGQPVPPGVIGELTIGGLGVARGYRNRLDLTVERFVPDRFTADPAARLYRTGDLARWSADGRLVHRGRNDFQIKVRGFRIEPGEIESVLARHASIAQCAVTAKPDASGTQQLVAYVVLRQGAALDATSLRAQLRALLPEYMVPNGFVALTALPLTANRKIDVKALPMPSAFDLAAHTKPEPDPQGLMAVQLIALWRQVLEDDTLGMHDNFFERGGHSLKAVQLLALIERVFARRLPLATLIEAPTVAQLEQAMSRADWIPPWRSLVALAVHGTRAPLHLVPGVGGNVLVFTGLAKLLNGERPVYGLQPPGLDGLEQPLRSVTALAEHHVREIRIVQPRGPYLVGGACTGGVIAYEIARRLQLRGERVELVLMESWHPSSYRRPGGRDHFAQALRFAFGRARAVLRTLLALPPRRWPSVLRRAWFNARLVDGALEESLAGNDYLSDRVVAATFEAVATYDALPFEGRLLNVIATSRPLADSTVDTRRQWEGLARQGAQRVELPAQDSGRLFVAPYLEPLTEALRRHLGQQL